MNSSSTNETQTLSLEEALRQAIQLHQAGNLDAAAQLYQAILGAVPGQPDANHNLGVIHFQRGEFMQAIGPFQVALSGNPNNGQFWVSYIDTLLTLNRPEDASNMLTQARQRGIQHPALDELAVRTQRRPMTKHDQLIIDFHHGHFAKVAREAQDLIGANPADGTAWKILGAALTSLGDTTAARDATIKASQLLPNEAETFNNLGILYFQLNQLQEARLAFERATTIDPLYADALNNLGGVLDRLGLHSEAEHSCRKALAAQPEHLGAMNNLALALRAQRRFTEALPILQHARNLDAERPDTLFNLASIHIDLGQFEAAIPVLEELTNQQPRMASAHSNLGVSLLQQRRLPEAERHLRRALELDPEDSDAHNNLGHLLMRQEHHDQAVLAFKQAIATSKGSVNPTVFSNLGCSLAELCQREEAAEALRKAQALNPQDSTAFSNLLFILSQDDTIPAEALFAEHCRFARTFEAPLTADWPHHAPEDFSAEKVRVGFVSSDFNNHAVAFFIAPILRHLTTNPGLEVHVYDVAGINDGMNNYLRDLIPDWHVVAGHSDAELAEKIREDRIGILIDLSSHTAGNRLMAFARKPAPVQVSWIGYPGTTGLQAMDYYLTDKLQVPREMFAEYFSEKLVHLPVSATYMPPADDIAVSELPALKNGHLTFGSFNKASKITRSCIALWSQALRAIPNARLVMLGIPEGSLREKLSAWFESEGIEQARLTFHPRLPIDQYLRLFQQVDICFDTYPYNGGTTTLGALWMGVPTITQVGTRITSRTGGGAMGHMGLDSFIAHSPAHFTELACNWANNVPELADLRSQLRSRLLNSPLCDPASVGKALERALIYMWQRWQQGHAAAAFDVSLDSPPTLLD